MLIDPNALNTACDKVGDGSKQTIRLSLDLAFNEEPPGTTLEGELLVYEETAVFHCVLLQVLGASTGPERILSSAWFCPSREWNEKFR
jgi:hypothetical protein